jgi:hypothetical protein
LSLPALPPFPAFGPTPLYGTARSSIALMRSMEMGYVSMRTFGGDAEFGPGSSSTISRTVDRRISLGSWLCLEIPKTARLSRERVAGWRRSI